MRTILCFVALSLTGWICLFIGLAKTRRYREKTAAETARAVGVIIGYEEGQKSAGRGRVATVYYPVVRFSVNSHEYTSTSSRYCSEPLIEGEKGRPPEGSEAVLYYNPANPFKFHLEQDLNDEGEGMVRIAKFIIAASAVLSVAMGFFMKW